MTVFNRTCTDLVHLGDANTAAKKVRGFGAIRAIAHPNGHYCNSKEIMCVRFKTTKGFEMAVFRSKST
jgi:hypothetical protein